MRSSQSFQSPIFRNSQIDQANLGLSREYLIKKLDEPFVQAYHSYQVDLAVLFGAQRQRAETEMKAALDFEIELAEVIIFECFSMTAILMDLF
jgi:hypothetical protein